MAITWVLRQQSINSVFVEKTFFIVPNEAGGS
ncbi:hypothetical protein HL670_04356 [Serratia plymuthica]|nr:hypothetical protein SOD10_42480 [Serratia plymuthica]QJW57447.1 hypothetical protein HL670_04356 [Serratia plymuthica]CAI0845418.1 Uncharacterised protein [Serratia plymuthica]